MTLTLISHQRSDGRYEFTADPDNLPDDVGDLSNPEDCCPRDKDGCTYVDHPNENYSGQCATSAQYLGGEKGLDGKWHDVPSTDDWREGEESDENTPYGTVVASGWDKNGGYPNLSNNNYTAIYTGRDAQGNYTVLEANHNNAEKSNANEGLQVRSLDAAETASFKKVAADTPHDERVSECCISSSRSFPSE